MAEFEGNNNPLAEWDAVLERKGPATSVTAVNALIVVSAAYGDRSLLNPSARLDTATIVEKVNAVTPENINYAPAAELSDASREKYQREHGTTMDDWRASAGDWMKESATQATEEDTVLTESLQALGIPPETAMLDNLRLESVVVRHRIADALYKSYLDRREQTSEESIQKFARALVGRTGEGSEPLTMAELNQRIKAMEGFLGSFGEEIKGVKIPDVIRKYVEATGMVSQTGEDREAINEVVVQMAQQEVVGSSRDVLTALSGEEVVAAAHDTSDEVAGETEQPADASKEETEFVVMNVEKKKAETVAGAQATEPAPVASVVPEPAADSQAAAVAPAVSGAATASAEVTSGGAASSPEAEVVANEHWREEAEALVVQAEAAEGDTARDLLQQAREICDTEAIANPENLDAQHNLGYCLYALSAYVKGEKGRIALKVKAAIAYKKGSGTPGLQVGIAEEDFEDKLGRYEGNVRIGSRVEEQAILSKHAADHVVAPQAGELVALKGKAQNRFPRVEPYDFGWRSEESPAESWESRNTRATTLILEAAKETDPVVIRQILEEALDWCEDEIDANDDNRDAWHNMGYAASMLAKVAESEADRFAWEDAALYDYSMSIYGKDAQERQENGDNEQIAIVHDTAPVRRVGDKGFIHVNRGDTKAELAMLPVAKDTEPSLALTNGEIVLVQGEGSSVEGGADTTYLLIKEDVPYDFGWRPNASGNDAGGGEESSTGGGGSPAAGESSPATSGGAVDTSSASTFESQAAPPVGQEGENDGSWEAINARAHSLVEQALGEEDRDTRQRLLNEARNLLGAEVQLHPDNRDAWNNLGFCRNELAKSAEDESDVQDLRDASIYAYYRAFFGGNYRDGLQKGRKGQIFFAHMKGPADLKNHFFVQAFEENEFAPRGYVHQSRVLWSADKAAPQPNELIAVRSGNQYALQTEDYEFGWRMNREPEESTTNEPDAGGSPAGEPGKASSSSSEEK